MCLENRLTGKEKEKAIAALPETFRVWKYCQKGQPEYRVKISNTFYKYEREPALARKRLYKAGNFPTQRDPLPYKPGYHAFLEGDNAKAHYRTTLREFEARRADVQEIGTFNKDYYNLKGVVLSHIKPV